MTMFDKSYASGDQIEVTPAAPGDDMRNGTTIPPVRNALIPRPMHSKSPEFEAGYTRFLEDVFAQGIQSVAREETVSTKALVLAGCRKLVLVKATGLLHMEQLDGTHHNESVEMWLPAKLPNIKFWEGQGALKNRIVSAWGHRISQFVPPSNVCFTVSDDAPYYWGHFINLAAQRRLAGKGNAIAAVKTFVLGLWRFLVDDERLRLCIACFGHGASLQDYNIAVKRRKELIERERETPNLAPLIGAYIQQSAKLRMGRIKVPSNVLPLAREWYFGADMSPAGWRYVAAGTRLFIESILRMGRGRDVKSVSSTSVFNLLAETGERHPLTFVMWLLNSMHRMEIALLNAERDSIVRFVRLAGREAIVAKRKKRLNRFVRGDLVLAWDWFTENERNAYTGGGIKKVHKNAIWMSIMRSQQAWHLEREERDRLRREANEREQRRYIEQQSAIRWETVVNCETINDVIATPLTSGKDLLNEAIQMKHCVGGYIDACASGVSRIFHLASRTEVATLELQTSDGKNWKVRQVFGRKNNDSSADMWRVSKELASKYSKATKAICLQRLKA